MREWNQPEGAGDLREGSGGGEQMKTKEGEYVYNVYENNKIHYLVCYTKTLEKEIVWEKQKKVMIRMKLREKEEPQGHSLLSGTL